MNEDTFSALSDPTRLRIIELLIDQPLTVGEIAQRLAIRQPQASKHLRVLNDAGLVDVRPNANRRIYTLRPEPFRALDTWLSTYRTLWAGRFDRLETYLQQLQQRTPPSDPDAP